MGLTEDEIEATRCQVEAAADPLTILGLFLLYVHREDG